MIQEKNHKQKNYLVPPIALIKSSEGGKKARVTHGQGMKPRKVKAEVSKKKQHPVSKESIHSGKFLESVESRSVYSA